MWFPFLKRLSRQAMNFILALTAGLLIFLLVDTGLEGIEIAEQVPEVFQGVPLVLLVGMLSFLGLLIVGRRSSWEGDEAAATSESRAGTTRSERLWIATAIAIGIGIHNLGEGLLVGAAVSSGEAALGSFLVVGFVLHNVTEGLGIGAPISNSEPGWVRFVGLVMVAGVPAIAGVWLGAFQYSPLMAVVFFAIGAGAILQVIVEVGRLLVEDAGSFNRALTSGGNIAGLTLGIVIMYATALIT
jgi:zinc transporter ZupT